MRSPSSRAGSATSSWTGRAESNGTRSRQNTRRHERYRRFISYSRADYYFAESLAASLAARGIPAWLDANDLEAGLDWRQQLDGAIDGAACLVLVVSPRSLASSHVRDEWMRARARGTPVVIARFGRGALPADLAGCAEVEFRAPFEGAVDRLAARVASPPVPGSSPATDGSAGGGPPPSVVARAAARLALPPWVAAVAGMLGLLTLAPFVTADYVGFFSAPATTPVQVVGRFVIAPIVLGLYVWYFLVAFLRRTMGLRRLAWTFAFFAYATAMPLLQAYGGPRVNAWLPTVPEASLRANVSVARELGPVVAGLLVTAVAGLVVVCLRRPRDLLRWAPTGAAWEAYRRGVATGAGARNLASRLRQLARFEVVCDPDDAPAAARLGDELRALGGRDRGRGDVPPGDDGGADGGTTTVVLLSNRTRLEWLRSSVSERDTRVVAVAATSIGLPAAFEWLWRRQWIDVRRWERDASSQTAGLAVVPESLTALRLPADVARAHHVLCALAGVVFASAGAVTSVEPRPALEAGATLSAVQWLSLAAFVASAAWVRPARRLVRRSTTETTFTRQVAMAALVSGPPAAACLWTLTTTASAVLFVLPAAAVLVGGPLWLLRQRTALAYWFPSRLPDPPRLARTLSPGRNWRTLLWVAVYALVWTGLLGASAP